MGRYSPKGVTLVFPPLPPFNGAAIQIDCTTSQSHDRETVVTEHPVETGAAVSDSIRPLPRRLSLSGVMTSSNPLDWPGRLSDEDDASHNSLQLLLELARLRGQTIQVVTGLDVYKNMAVRSARFPKEPGVGDNLFFALDLQEIVFATAQTVVVPASAIASPKTAKQAAKRQHRGRMPTRAPTAAEKPHIERVKTSATHVPRSAPLPQ